MQILNIFNDVKYVPEVREVVRKLNDAFNGKVVELD